MAGKIAVIDFPPRGERTSHFVVTDVEGRGGLVACIESQGFEVNLIDFKELGSTLSDPKDYAAVFFASGWSQIRDPDTGKISSELESACELYGSFLSADVPIIGFPHGSQILTAYTGGDYFKLDNTRTRKEPFGGYVMVDEDASNHWLLEGISEPDLRSGEFAREYREYGIDIKNSDFRALVNPDDDSAGPAIAVHNDPTKLVVLFMMHPEFNGDLPAYELMENVFGMIRDNHSRKSN